MFEKFTLEATTESPHIVLPIALGFKGKTVFVRHLGNALVLLPADAPWEGLFSSLSLFSEDFMKEREQPSNTDTRLSF